MKLYEFGPARSRMYARARAPRRIGEIFPRHALLIGLPLHHPA